MKVGARGCVSQSTHCGFKIDPMHRGLIQFSLDYYYSTLNLILAVEQCADRDGLILVYFEVTL